MQYVHSIQSPMYNELQQITDSLPERMTALHHPTFKDITTEQHFVG